MENPVLELVHIRKTFGMTEALSDMSLQILPGEVHAVVGENGAGKSTMIKIMTGVHHPTSGQILVDGQEVKFSNTKDAQDKNIVAIYQEPMVFPDLDVAENIFIGSTQKSMWRKPKIQRAEASQLIERIGMHLSVDRMANGLTLAEQQAVEIARALSQSVRVLIMDEPTASLSAHEARNLRQIAKGLANEGVAVIYISHRLEEIFEIADRVTVIRDGQHISTRPIAEVTSQSMIAEMVGRDVGNYFKKMKSTTTDSTLLEVKNLGVLGVFEDINFKLNKGEVLCMSGLIGARRTDVALSIFGVHPATAGEIIFDGQSQKISSVKQAMELGIAYVSEDRRKLGLAMPMDIRSNISLATLSQFLNSIGIIQTNKESAVAEDYREKLHIRTPNIELPVGNLSGGNQQKVMLAKWLNMEPKLLIFDEPTRGIDVGAKAEVHDLIREFAAAGGAVLVISSDLPEVLALGDRILVMREGLQMGILENKDVRQETVMALATGQIEEAV